MCLFALSRLLLSWRASLFAELPLFAIKGFSLHNPNGSWAAVTWLYYPRCFLFHPCPLVVFVMVIRDSNIDVFCWFRKVWHYHKTKCFYDFRLVFASSPVWKCPSQFVWCCGISKIPRCRGLLEHRPTKSLSYSSNCRLWTFVNCRWQLSPKVTQRHEKLFLRRLGLNCQERSLLRGSGS
jgi:hypothetical protein